MTDTKTILSTLKSTTSLFIIGLLLGLALGGAVYSQQTTESEAEIASAGTGPAMEFSTENQMQSENSGVRITGFVSTTYDDGTTANGSLEANISKDKKLRLRATYYVNGSFDGSTDTYRAGWTKLSRQKMPDDEAKDLAEHLKTTNTSTLAMNNTTNTAYYWNPRLRGDIPSPSRYILSMVGVPLSNITSTKATSVAWNGQDALKYETVSTSDAVKRTTGHIIVDAETKIIYKIQINATLRPEATRRGQKTVNLSYTRHIDQDPVVTPPTWAKTARTIVPGPSPINATADASSSLIGVKFQSTDVIPPNSTVTVITPEQTFTTTVSHPMNRGLSPNYTYVGLNNQSAVVWEDLPAKPPAETTLDSVNRVIISKNGFEYVNTSVRRVSDEYDVSIHPLADSAGRVYEVTIDPGTFNEPIPRTVQVMATNRNQSITESIWLGENYTQLVVYRNDNETLTINRPDNLGEPASDGFNSAWTIRVSALGQNLGTVTLPNESVNPVNSTVSANISATVSENQTTNELEVSGTIQSLTNADYVVIGEPHDGEFHLHEKVTAGEFRVKSLNQNTQLVIKAVGRTEHGGTVTRILYNGTISESSGRILPK